MWTSTPIGGYSLYNWELFFHAPLMIAERLDQNLQFEAADHWFKYIFNPTDGSSYPSPDKYWVTKPFFENVNDKYTQQNINNIMLGIDQGDSGAGTGCNRLAQQSVSAALHCAISEPLPTRKRRS